MSPSDGNTHVAESDGLSDPQALAALWLASGAKVKTAAAHAGVDPRTVQRWRRELPAFREAVNRLRSEILSQAVGKLTRSATKAAGVLRGLLDNPDPTIQLQASKAILDQLVKLRTATEFEARLELLEDAQNQR